MIDFGNKLVSAVLALAINGGLFAGMAFAGLLNPEEPEPTYEAIDVEVLQLPAQGKERPESALPRIVRTQTPDVEADTASLSREKEEELEREKKKKEDEQRKLDEEKRRLDEEKKQLAEERKKERDRKRAMTRALNNLDDRGDEDNPDGFAKGDKYGTSLDPNSLRNQRAYGNRVKAALSRQFQVPATIPRDELKRLSAKVWFKVNKDGKVTASKLRRGSGNRFFDEASMRTLKRFGAGTALRIPLPPSSQKKLRRQILRKGITTEMLPPKK